MLIILSVHNQKQNMSYKSDSSNFLFPQCGGSERVYVNIEDEVQRVSLEDQYALLDTLIFSKPPKDIDVFEVAQVGRETMTSYIEDILQSPADTNEMITRLEAISVFASRLSRLGLLSVNDPQMYEGLDQHSERYFNTIKYLGVIIDVVQQYLEGSDFNISLMAHAVVLETLGCMDGDHAVWHEDARIARLQDIYNEIFDNQIPPYLWESLYTDDPEKLAEYEAMRILFDSKSPNTGRALLVKMKESGLLADSLNIESDYLGLIAEQMHRVIGDDIFSLTKNQAAAALRFTLSGDMESNLKLHKLLKGMLDNDRTEFLGAFLAMEFGDEFGNVLVDIAEKVSTSELQSLLHEINSVRASSEHIRQFYGENVDSQLGLSIESAFNKRTTEVLALVKRIANGQQLLVHDRSTDQVEEAAMNLDQALQSLRDIANGLQVLANGISGNFVVTQVVHDEKDFRGQLVHEDGRLKSTLRPRATRAGEARISYDVLDEEKRKLTIRLDLDTRFVAGGQLSLDIGSTTNAARNKEIAYFLSLAEAAFAQEQGRDIRNLNGYHVREAFDALPVDPQQFETWVNKYLYAIPVSD